MDQIDHLCACTGNRVQTLDPVQLERAKIISASVFRTRMATGFEALSPTVRYGDEIDLTFCPIVIFIQT